MEREYRKSGRKLTTLGLVVALGGLAAGCAAQDGSGPGTSPGCEGGKCDAVEFEVVPPPLWLECFVDGTSLMCSSPDARPIAVNMLFVELKDADGRQVAAGMLEDPGADPQPVLELEGVELPIQLDALFGFADAEDVTGLSVTHLSYTSTLEPTMTEAEPLTVHAPFAFWPVQVAVADGLFIFDATMTLDASPFTHPSGSSEILISNHLGAVNPDPPALMYLVAPASGAVEGRGVWADSTGGFAEMTTSLDGPGRYVGEAEGLRPATADDLALFDTDDPDTDGSDTDGSDTDGSNTDMPEPECDDASFLPWLERYLQQVAAVQSAGVDTGEAAELAEILAERPCNSTSDEAYLVWFESYAPMVSNTGTLIDSDEAAAIEAMAQVMPVATGHPAFEAWHATFAETWSRFVPSRSDRVDTGEAAVLELVLAAKPLASAGESYQLWLSHFAEIFDGYLPSSSATIDSTESDNLEWISAARPSATDAGAYAAWMAYYDQHFQEIAPNSSASTDTNEASILERLAIIRPATQEPAAWFTWLTMFEARASTFGSFVDSNERKQAETLAIVKPCVGEDVEAEAAYAEFRERLGDPIADLAAPRCEG